VEAQEYKRQLLQFNFEIATVTHCDICDTVASGEGNPFGTEAQSLGNASRRFERMRFNIGSDEIANSIFDIRLGSEFVDESDL